MSTTSDVPFKERTTTRDSHKGPIRSRTELCRPGKNHSTSNTTVNSSTKTNTVFKEPVTPERLNYMADLSHGYDGQIDLTDQSHKHTLTNQFINKAESTELTEDLGYVTDYSRDVKQPPPIKPRRSLLAQR